MERRNDNETAEGTERKPSWIKVRLPNGREFWDVKQLVEGKTSSPSVKKHTAPTVMNVGTKVRPRS